MRSMVEGSESPGTVTGDCPHSRSVWEGDDGEWRTDFPPPEGFDGWEEGEPGDEDNRRGLTREELEAVGADEESEAEERAERLAEEHEARMRYFGLDGMTPAGEADKDES